MALLVSVLQGTMVTIVRLKETSVPLILARMVHAVM